MSYRQKESSRWDNYEEARVWFNQLPKKARKRIRRRAGGHFEVVLYEAVPEVKAPEAPAAPAAPEAPIAVS